MYRLKYLTFQHGASLYFVIYEQTKKFTNQGTPDPFNYQHSSGHQIRSMRTHAFEDNILYLRGSSDRTRQITHSVRRVSKLNLIANSKGIHTILADWSAKAKEFQTLEPFEQFIVNIPDDVVKEVMGDRTLTMSGKLAELEVFASYV